VLAPLAVFAQAGSRQSAQAIAPAASQQSGRAATGLDPRSFLHPPDAAKPWVFWYWMQAAVSKEGIRADLQAMKSAGIGGAYLMPIQGAANPPIYTPAAQQLSPRWWEMVRFAMQIADSLGLRLAMHDCDGFAVAGGPWITPALSMQKITWSRTTVEGGRDLDIDLPEPPGKENYYQDIAILALPTPATWYPTDTPTVTTNKGNAQYLAHPGSKESFKTDEPAWIQYAYERPFTCRTIVIRAVNNYQAQRLLLQTSDDGISFHDITRLTPPRHGWQDGDADVTHTIPAVTARYFRFVYDKAGSEPGAEDLDAAKWKPSLKLNGIGLSATPAIYQFEGKTGAVWRVSKPSNPRALPDSLCIDPNSIVDLTVNTDAKGHLRWRAPVGHWTILRIGHTSTGHTNATGGGGKGLECDKFNPEAIRLQFDHWFGEAIRRAGPELASQVLKIFHVDSWECGSQNWSPVFREEFQKRRGYDLLRWLPAITGVPIASADSSERFLHDIRETINELLHDEFYTIMKDEAHQHGCKFSAECVAPTFTSDGMYHFSEADIPMGEFWLRSPTHDKPNDMADAISGAHLYGKPIVQAEAFTELREAWDEYPGMLKTLQDRNYALGINRMVFHVFTHNPWLDRKPGMTLGGVGTFLQRDQTWWPQAKAWVDYTGRCQWLLQQGRPVVDIAVFTGEELPRRAILPPVLVSTLPGLFGSQRVNAEKTRLANTGEPTTKAPNGVVHSANMADPADWIDPLHGYAFDSFNPDALLHLATVRDGRIELPGGASYGLLVLPGATPMNPDPGAVSAAVAQKLLELVKAGATILIDPAANYHSNTLTNAHAGDSVVKSVFARLLGGHTTTGSGYASTHPRESIAHPGESIAHPGEDIIRIGHGRVIIGPWQKPTLISLGIRPDVITGSKTIAYTHRTTADADIYFFSNQSDQRVSITLRLRTTGGAPMYFDPIAGDIDTLTYWSQRNPGTLGLTLDGHGSRFIVIPRKAALPRQFASFKDMGFMLRSAKQTRLAGTWSVQFDTAYGGPAEPRNFDSLTSWTTNADSDIQYYSGPAVYHLSFQWKPIKAIRGVFLDPGTVHDIATLTLNGVDCGTDWTGNMLDVTKAIRPGENKIEITATNTWNNRLLGDEHLPEGQRRTWTSAPKRPDNSLLPAGLIGPVRIVAF
jgi:hypothetical protein